MENKSVVLLSITEEMVKNCPFSEQRCFECLSQACKPDQMEDDMSWMEEFEFDEED